MRRDSVVIALQILAIAILILMVAGLEYVSAYVQPVQSLSAIDGQNYQCTVADIDAFCQVKDGDLVCSSAKLKFTCEPD